MLSPGLTTTLACTAIACAAAVSTQAQAQGFTFSQLGIGAGNESNVPRGQDGPHRQESNFLSLEYSIGRLFELGAKNTLVLTGAVAASRYADLRGFDRQGLSVAASYNYKWALGAYAPVLSLSAAYGIEDYEGEARDNDLLTLDINYLKRMSPAWLVSLGADYQRSGADSLTDRPLSESFGYDPVFGLSSGVYDYDSSSLYVELEYAFENGVLLDAGLRRVDGYSVSSTTRPTPALYRVADAIYTDSAFDGSWLAYRLEADTDEWSLGLSIPSGRDSSINFGYSYYDIAAVSGKTYRNRIATVSYVHNF